MKRIFVWALLCLMGNGLLFAQIKDFDLSQYKLPNLKRQSLSLDFDLNNYSYLNYHDSIKISKQNSRLNLNVNYNLYINNPYYQG